jgi:hypothetical protein
MQQQICARFSLEGGQVSILDTKITDPDRRRREARVMPELIWLIRKAAVIESFSAAPLFEKTGDVNRFTAYEQESIVLYARAGRLDDLTDYPVTTTDTRWDLIVPSTPQQREEYDRMHDPAYRPAAAGE